jgi:hypothetical protein
MVTKRKSQKNRLTSFCNGFCPYCGTQGAHFDELATSKGKVKGYRGSCVNPDCKAENFFTNKKAKEWMEGN